MTELVYEGYSGTVGTAVIRCGLAVAFSASMIGPPSPSYVPAQLTSAKVIQASATPFASVVTEDLAPLDNIPSFEDQMAGFYESLQGRQEALGSAFEKVLFDNLWDLYAEA